MSGYKLVAAIDFGTSYSGYAFSTRDNFKIDPLQIHAKQAWNAGAIQLMSEKTPTCLLLDKRKKIVSFGYEAENGYADLALDDKHHDYYYFSRFKMKLYQNKDLNEETKLEDVTGKSLLAMEVFALSIKALIKHLCRLLKNEGKIDKTNEIKWVLTVPAIWPDNAKQFMRKCAEKAGIEDDNLVICLEPEAASIHCQYLPIKKLKGATEGFTMSGTGAKYMVVDLGGGTADITAHEKLEGGQLKELCCASGGECGGTSVDNAFIQLIIKILGAPLFNELKTTDPSSYLDLLRAFEIVKRTIETSSQGKINFLFPCATLNSLCENRHEESLSTMLQDSPYADQIAVKGDKLRVDADIMKSLFQPTVKNIEDLVKDVFKNPSAAGVNLILLVGGLSECGIIQSELKKAFPNKKIIIPEEAGLSVLKGAVLFGHNPDYIVSRVVRFSYGINTSEDFDPNKHDMNRQYTNKYGEEMCNGVFSMIMKQNTSVPVGMKVYKSYFTPGPFEDTLTLDLYVSNKETPQYVDDESCVLIGKAVIDIPFPSEESRGVDVEYIFGNTEISLKATEQLYGEEYEAKFKLI